MELPNTMAGRQAAWLVELLRSGGEGVPLSVVEQQWPLAAGTALATEEGLRILGPRAPFVVARIAAVHERGPLALSVELDDQGVRLLWDLEVSGEPPHPITDMRLRSRDGIKLTALQCAGIRAIHAALVSPPVFDDYLAATVGGAYVQAAVARALDTPMPLRVAQRSASIAARARLAEDELLAALDDGRRQYVILGAGLDTFAYRRPELLDRLRVFEVDEPVTQAWKRRRLAEASITEPDGVRFVPVDFATQDLTAELCAAGFDPEAPAFVAMLGVSYYIGTNDLERTAASVATWAPGTSFVFDYWLPAHAWDDWERFQVAALAMQGEPMRTFFEPAEIESALRRAGFIEVHHLDNAAIAKRYFEHRVDGLHPEPVFQLVIGRV